MASIPEKALSWAKEIANDPKHGYSQSNRWGKKGTVSDFDCSSFVLSAYRDGAGVPIGNATYTGNMGELLKHGFKDVSKSVNLNTGSGLQRGDIIFYHKSGNIGHAVMYAGNGQIVHARGASYGSTKPGDQGSEIAVTPYYRGNFDRVYRYTGKASTAKPAVKRYSVQTTLPIVKYGSVGRAVKVWQEVIGVEADGEFGKNTLAATLAFQRSCGLEDDGEVGSQTWAAGLKSVN